MSAQTICLATERATPLPRRDLRTATRLPCSWNTLCQVRDPRGGLLGSAWVRDLSATGIGLFLERRYEPGTVLALELSHRKRRLCCRLLLRVTHSTELSPGHWLHGGTLSRKLGNAELRVLLP
jgi:hypothetical protein